MIFAIDTSYIPTSPFRATARKNNTNRLTRRCPLPDPTWLTSLVAKGCNLQLEDLVVQAGRHYSDRIYQNLFSSNPSRRQAATAIAWTVISLVAPSVNSNQLFVEDPVDGDIKRLCSEILGVGMTLEVLRKQKVIDGRTILKLSGSFDFEANGPNGNGRIKIEAKGTFNDASTSAHRTSIWKKISANAPPRGYDRAIGIIAGLWSAGQMRDFDIEICDPEGGPDDHFETAVRETVRFYARRFDEAVAIPEGTDLLFSIADDPHLFDKAWVALPKSRFDLLKWDGALYRDRLRINRAGLSQEFWGRIWEPRKLPIPLELEGVRDPGGVKAFMGVDSAVYLLILGGDFRGLLSYEMNDSGLWRAESADYRAVFCMDSYGIVRGLCDGDLPMEVEAR